MNTQNLILLESDYQRLINLVKTTETETAELLEDELNRATIVKNFTAPLGFVTMNSIVSFLDETSGRESTIELVYPNEVSTPGLHQRVSILAPIGAALIGLQIGHTITWPLPNGKVKRLKVTSVSKEK